MESEATSTSTVAGPWTEMRHGHSGMCEKIVKEKTSLFIYLVSEDKCNTISKLFYNLFHSFRFIRDLCYGSSTLSGSFRKRTRVSLGIQTCP